MKSLAEHLIEIKKHLSSKERWEECWENNKITGYSSGSLSNTLGGLWSPEGRNHYRPAYDCVARAIIFLFGPIKESRRAIISQGIDPEYLSYCPKIEDIRTLRAFEERKCHEDLMKVLDLAIRYAKLYVFS